MLFSNLLVTPFRLEMMACISLCIILFLSSVRRWLKTNSLGKKLVKVKSLSMDDRRNVDEPCFKRPTVFNNKTIHLVFTDINLSVFV